MNPAAQAYCGKRRSLLRNKAIHAHRSFKNGRISLEFLREKLSNLRTAAAVRGFRLLPEAEENWVDPAPPSKGKSSAT